MPIRAIPEGDGKGVEFFTRGGKTKVNSLEIHELSSSWR